MDLSDIGDNRDVDDAPKASINGSFLPAGGGSKSMSSTGEALPMGENAFTACGCRMSDKSPAEVRREERVSNFEKKNEGRYAWLLDQRDANQRAPSDEDFDPRTLYIPKSAYAKFSSFER